MNTNPFYVLSSVFFLGAASLLFSGCPSESTQKADSKITESIVENVNGAASGVAEGLEEGRKPVTDDDGAIILSTPEELAGKVDIEIIDVSKSADRIYVSLAVMNKTDKMYSIMNLFSKNNVFLLDEEGYITRPNSFYNSDTTIPPNTKDKLSINFSTEASHTYPKIRIFGKEYPLPAMTATGAESKVRIKIDISTPLAPTAEK